MNPAYSGGRHTGANGYVFALAPDHPATDVRGYVYEHRLIMEAALGRYLEPEEVVHHINGDKLDNRIDNLALYANHSEHMKDHHANR